MRAPLCASARLLIRVPNWLGDLVMAEPVLRSADLRGAVTLVGPAHLLSLFEGRFPNCDRLYSDSARDWRGHGAALLLTGSFRSAWIAARAGIPVRAGLARDGRGLLLTHAMTPARELGAVPLGLGIHGRGRRWLPRPFGTVCVELASLVGLHVPDRAPLLIPTDAARERVARRLSALDLARPFAVANVGSRAGSAKGAPASVWQAVLAEFARQSDLPIVLVSGPGEEAALTAVQSAAPAPRLHGFPGPAADLAELTALFSMAQVVITADNGPRHIASALGTPLSVMCGPTDPRHTADHLRSTRIVRATQPCSPCHRECCPLEGPAHLACFTGIDPSEVARSALELRAHAVECAR